MLVNWLSSKTYCKINAAVAKNAFCQPDRKANRLEEKEESDRLNAFWSGRGRCRLASFKTYCRTDIAVHFVDEYSVLRC